MKDYPESLYYVSTVRMPTEKAYGYQIAQLCAALGEQGVSVRLRVARRSGTHSVAEYYGVPNTFAVEFARIPDPFRWEGWLGGYGAFLLSRIAFFVSNMLYPIPKGSVVFTRDVEIAFLFSLRGYRTFYNAHNVPRHTFFHDLLLMGAAGIIANSEGTAAAYRGRGFTRVDVVPNGVNMERFRFSEDKTLLRKELGLPETKPIVLYAGHLYAWKGVDILVRAAKQLPHVRFVLVGGTREAQQKYSGIANLQLVEHQSPVCVPRYLKAADVLVLPNTRTSVESERYTSPLKLFEYMASGVPIVAADVPATHEILSERNAHLYTPDDEADLVEHIQQALAEQDDSRKRADAAYREVEESYTWETIAQKLLTLVRYS